LNDQTTPTIHDRVSSPIWPQGDQSSATKTITFLDENWQYFLDNATHQQHEVTHHEPCLRDQQLEEYQHKYTQKCIRREESQQEWRQAEHDQCIYHSKPTLLNKQSHDINIQTIETDESQEWRQELFLGHDPSIHNIGSAILDDNPCEVNTHIIEMDELHQECRQDLSLEHDHTTNSSNNNNGNNHNTSTSLYHQRRQARKRRKRNEQHQSSIVNPEISPHLP
jgi:hypothetical protein